MIEIKVSLGKQCICCHRRNVGVAPNGLCFDCIGKKIRAGDYDNILKQKPRKPNP